MSVLKYNEISKMNDKERATKLQELRLEQIKSSVSANKARAKTKEIKRAIARLSTFNKSHREELKNK